MESEASVSGISDPSFCCSCIFNSLLVTDLDRIRRRYEFLDGFSLTVPSRGAYIRQSGFVTLYEDTLIVGLRLPFHPLVRDLLIFLGIALGQLAPNGWRFLMGAIHLYP